MTVFSCFPFFGKREKGFPHMNLADSRLRELDNPALPLETRISLRCRLACEFIHIGQYDSAREALGEFWHGVGKRPRVEGLEAKAAAEVLLQCGTLSGWIGASQQLTGAQEAAKDLISESITLLESLGETARVAIARSDLALCYWREGAYDEARVLLMQASDEASGKEDEDKARVLLRWVTVECAEGRFNYALNILKECSHILDESHNHALKGSFHNLFAVALQGLGTLEGHADYFDKAIIEYTAAIYHYEQAQHKRYGASIENNLAFLLYKLGRHEEAHEHLDRARKVLARLKDVGLLAQVDETRARVFIAEQKYREANHTITSAIQMLENGGEPALLADALIVQGVAWARLGVHKNSVSILHRALNLAEESGALSHAGLAALTLIEEHGAKRLSQTELYNLYTRADKMLQGTQNADGEMARLRASARIVLKRLSGGRIHDKDFSLYGAVYDFEAKFIEQALDEAQGSVTLAAELLGIRHQSLTNMLMTRHKNLLKKRTPAKKRGRSIFKKK
ncbi:MAG TPA: helix-turn-helix domain-containing protein [Pyrinomonadaceae bacterium]|nr:helix-turn-helix domain-containing protein [Pyrinomonadaceae bacterium]